MDKNREKTNPLWSAQILAPPNSCIRSYLLFITNTYANTPFSCLFYSITGIIMPIPWHAEKEQVCLMKKGRWFSCKKKGYTTYDYPEKGKITAIVESASENNNTQSKKRVAFFNIKEKSLLLYSSFISKDLSYESPLTIKCTLGKKIKTTTLIDTCTTRFGLIDEKFMGIVWKGLEIQPQCLTKQKPI